MASQVQEEGRDQTPQTVTSDKHSTPGQEGSKAASWGGEQSESPSPGNTPETSTGRVAGLRAQAGGPLAV